MTIKSTIVSVYSESLGERDYLRNQINACGLNAICFEMENTSIDNLKTLQPEIVIVQTDSAHCVWRFLFSIHLAGLSSSMVVLSERLNIERFADMGHAISMHLLSNHHQKGRLSKKILELTTKRTAKMTSGNVSLFVGESEVVRQIRSSLPNIADSRDAVLIVGERGTGKEHLSRVIVEASRTNKHLVKIDCGALEPQVLVNGALHNILNPERKSQSITVLLDKIHLISLELQADLLLLVEEAQKLDGRESGNPEFGVRFIATSENEIETLVSRGMFRKDLFYRLNVIPLYLPPLRHRKADISLLMDFFIIDSCVKNNRCIVIPSQKVRDVLYMHDWPGNADELNSFMNRVSNDGNESCILKDHNLQKDKESVGKHLLSAAGVEELPKTFEIKDFIPTAKSLSLKSICDEFVSRTERRLMKRALESTNWNRKKAAELLNISYKSMLNKMKIYEII